MTRFLLALLLAAFAAPPARANVYGSDDRHPLPFPVPVGKLLLGAQSFCTATLVGPARLLTAAHCLIDGETMLPRYPAPLFTVRDGEGHWSVAHIRSVLWAGYDPARYFGDDLIEAELDLPLGWKVGYWPAVEKRFEGLYGGVEEALTLVAFHHDLDPAQAYASAGLVREDQDNGQLAHDLDLTAGSSGGPLVEASAPDLHDARVVAVQAKEFSLFTEFYTKYTHGTRNVAARFRRSFVRDAPTYELPPASEPPLCPTPAAAR